MSATLERRSHLRHRLRKMLSAHPEERLCAVCLAKALDEALDVIADTLTEIESFGGFQRKTASCAGCGQPRIVIGRA